MNENWLEIKLPKPSATPPSAAKLANAVAVIILLGAILGLDSGRSHYSPESQHFNRFKTDNASGAAANALEHMANRPLFPKFDWLVVGVGVLILAQLFRLNQRLEALLQSPPIPPPPSPEHGIDSGTA